VRQVGPRNRNELATTSSGQLLGGGSIVGRRFGPQLSLLGGRQGRANGRRELAKTRGKLRKKTLSRAAQVAASWAIFGDTQRPNSHTKPDCLLQIGRRPAETTSGLLGASPGQWASRGPCWARSRDTSLGGRPSTGLHWPHWPEQTAESRRLVGDF